MDSVILKSEHIRIVGEIKRRARLFCVAVCVVAFTLSLILSARPSMEKPKEEVIEILRSIRGQPVSVGQALDIAEAVLSECRAYDISINVVLGIISIESQFKTYAVSGKGNWGLLQIGPETWKIYIGDRALRDHRNAHEINLNLKVGVHYLFDLYAVYHDWGKVLRHFYSGLPTRSKAGDLYVRKVLEKAREYQGKMGG